MAAEENDEERRRRDDAEEERHYWESLEDARRDKEKQEAEQREAAIETMEKWFFEQFEDPQNETPRDSESQTYIYPWGGPFEASDVLHGQFSHDFDQALIDAAVERIERDGTTEWAPTSYGDYYEHPDPEQDAEGQDATVRQLTQQVLDRLDKLEAAVAELPGRPGTIGHNVPPEEVGLPPYEEVNPTEIKTAIVEVHDVLAQDDPDPLQLVTLSRRFDGWGTKIGHWLAKKADLAVDEAVKNGMKLAAASVLLHELGHDLITLAKHLLAQF
ncbi:hypothetical protein KY084_15715 [Stakelama sp. CBK3Z-3]|uniref:Uncharacterized protein n=1 Tax=Stakelama flava TaxID=2860338 RepID=A0ABS6XQ03_9SPHN|nr:hypothetical protein [Stakelama flava]MBW4332255.1 hypothetical protein [Stakelama flava]MBW4332304.1 hypothetical protein [Stakelama flava]